MTSDKMMKTLMLTLISMSFAGAAFAGLSETGRDANNGDASAQRQLSARYASGNEVVKDDLLSEQWLLRAEPGRSATSGGDALEALREKREASGAEPPTAKIKSMPKKSSTSGKARRALSRNSGKTESQKNVEEVAPVDRGDDFERLLRAASQGNRLALQRFQTDPGMRNRFIAYAKTPEGKKNPFVAETLRRLKK